MVFRYISFKLSYNGTSNRKMYYATYYIKSKNEWCKKDKSRLSTNKKNKPIENFLPDCGFVNENNSWTFNVNEEFKYPDFIEVVDE